MEVAMTFADFALTEARFRKHFRKVPRDAWNDNMVVLSEFIELPESEREGLFPYIWTVDKKTKSGQSIGGCSYRRLL
jgi:pyruvate-ferredoxin/flavodoxin oxidoreductase